LVPDKGRSAEAPDFFSVLAIFKNSLKK